MEIIKDIDSFNPIKSSVLTIGSYDGLHIGHISLLKMMVEFAKKNNIPAVLVTFDPHPKEILSNNKIKLITSFKIKMDLIEKLGIDYVCVIGFSYQFSKMSAKNFLNKIINPIFNPKRIYIGFDHHFGKDREGDSNFLLEYGNKNNIKIEVIEPINNINGKVSSSKIRNYIELGNMRRVSSLLGSFYILESVVVHGSGRGSSLGFPTANIEPIEKNQLLPKNGVYFIRGMINGQPTFGMCNIGHRPTFKENDFVIEVHFFHDSLNDIYGLILRIEFLERIRDEINFPTPKKLVRQLNLDKQTCLKIKSNYK